MKRERKEKMKKIIIGMSCGVRKKNIKERRAQTETQRKRRNNELPFV